MNWRDLIKRIENLEFGEIHSLIVFQRGDCILEKYFAGYDAETLHEAQSITKSIQSLLVGMALDKGFIKSLDQKIQPFFPEYVDINWSVNKKNITIRHLLTMTAGFEWHESQVSYKDILGNSSNLLAGNADWLYFALSRNITDKPGSRFNYSSAAPILLSKIIKEATGFSNEDFANQYLFEPLGIREYYFQRDLRDFDVLGDIDLRPMDLAKIGLLVLQKGSWEGKQIVSKTWIEESTHPHIFTGEKGEHYGYFWWRKAIYLHKKTINCIYAWGYGGQHIFILPELELLVICTAGLYEQNQAEEPYSLLENCILQLI